MQNIFQKLREVLFSEQGITLVELIIAITVMVLMLGITSIYLPTYRANQVKKQAALDLNDSLRYAQSLAVSPSNENIKYYHWNYNPDTNEITILDDADKLERTVRFDGGDKVAIVSNIDDIYIKTKTPGLYADPSLTTEAVGSIQIFHISQQKANDMFYQINVANNSFNLTREIVGETSDGANPNYNLTSGQR